MAKIRGLGRGLDALLGADEPAAGGETLASLAIDALQPGRFQPRARIDQEALAELAESIKSGRDAADIGATDRSGPLRDHRRRAALARRAHGGARGGAGAGA